MKLLRIATTALVAMCPFTPMNATESPARSYLSGLAIGQEEVLRFQISSPRMTTREFDKAISDETIRTALNRNHLARLGALRIARSALLGGQPLETGTYGFGLAIGEEGAFTLSLATEGRQIAIPLETVRDTSGETPQLTISFLAEESIEAFQLELRFGALRGTAPLSFALDEVAAGMNNLAYEILMEEGEPLAALSLANHANQLTGGRIAGVLDTLALAQFANGRTEEAIRTQVQALNAMGPEQGKERVRMEAQLRRFQEQQSNQ